MIARNEPLNSFWRQSARRHDGCATPAIGDDDCVCIYLSVRSRRFGRFVRDAVAKLLDTRPPSAHSSGATDPPGHAPAFDLASDQQDGANVGHLGFASVLGSGTRLPISVASSDVQPASEKDEAVLYRPEDVQHFDDKPQIQAEQH